MKTTIELPESLVLRAKRAALERRTTLRQLVENGLKRELATSSGNGNTHPLESIAKLGRGQWPDKSADSYVNSLRAGW